MSLGVREFRFRVPYGDKRMEKLASSVFGVFPALFFLESCLCLSDSPIPLDNQEEM